MENDAANGRTDREPEAARPYDGIWAYYADEMKLLDVQLTALHARRKEEASDPQTDPLRGMYISEEEFVRLVADEERGGRDDDPELRHWRSEASRMRRLISERLAASRIAKRFLPLPYVSAIGDESSSSEQDRSIGIYGRVGKQAFGYVSFGQAQSRIKIILANSKYAGGVDQPTRHAKVGIVERNMAKIPMRQHVRIRGSGAEEGNARDAQAGLALLCLGCGGLC